MNTFPARERAADLGQGTADSGRGTAEPGRDPGRCKNSLNEDNLPNNDLCEHLHQA